MAWFDKLLEIHKLGQTVSLPIAISVSQGSGDTLINCMLQSQGVLELAGRRLSLSRAVLAAGTEGLSPSYLTAFVVFDVTCVALLHQSWPADSGPRQLQPVRNLEHASPRL